VPAAVLGTGMGASVTAGLRHVSLAWMGHGAILALPAMCLACTWTCSAPCQCWCTCACGGCDISELVDGFCLELICQRVFARGAGA